MPPQPLERSRIPHDLGHPRAVEPPVVLAQCAWHPGIVALHLVAEGLVIRVLDIAAGQGGGLGPVAAHLGEELGDPLQAAFGQFAEGGDLAAEDVQQRRAARVAAISSNT